MGEERGVGGVSKHTQHSLDANGESRAAMRGYISSLECECCVAGLVSL